MVSPNYPQLTAQHQQAGVVVVQADISRSGRVSPVRAVSGPPALQAEAMNAVRLWRYKPYLRDGAAVEVTTEIVVTFTPGTTGGLITHPNG